MAFELKKGRVYIDLGDGLVNFTGPRHMQDTLETYKRVANKADPLHEHSTYRGANVSRSLRRVTQLKLAIPAVRTQAAMQGFKFLEDEHNAADAESDRKAG